MSGSKMILCPRLFGSLKMTSYIILSTTIFRKSPCSKVFERITWLGISPWLWHCYLTFSYLLVSSCCRALEFNTNRHNSASLSWNDYDKRSLTSTIFGSCRRILYKRANWFCILSTIAWIFCLRPDTLSNTIIHRSKEGFPTCSSFVLTFL